jgi:hypothetical protein
MAKNIKLKDLLNEQDPVMKRVAGYTTPKDRYFTSPDAAFNKLTKGAEKAAGKSTTAVAPAISPLKKSPLELTREDKLKAIADTIYDAKGYLYDDEQEAYDAITSIKNLEDWEFVETYFETEYGKTLSAYLMSNNFFGGLTGSDPTGDKQITKKLADWIGQQAWMPQDKKDEYLDKLYNRDIEKYWDPSHGMFGSRGLGTVSNLSDFLDLASTTLDAIPVLGWAASSAIDLANAGLFVVKGDLYNAGMRTAFAALPGVSGGAAVKLSKAALSKLGDKVAIALDSGKKALSLTADEIAALKLLNKSQTKIITNLLTDFSKKLKDSTLANKAIQGYKNLSKSVQRQLVKSITAISNSTVGKTILDFITKMGTLTAAEKALRAANAVTDSQMKTITQDLYTRLNSKFIESINYAKRYNPALENVKTNLTLASILETKIISLQEKEWDPREELKQAQENRIAELADDSFDIADLIYWGYIVAAIGGAYLAYKGGSKLLKVIGGIGGKDQRNLLWNKGFNIKSWMNTANDKQLLKKWGITLTAEEYANMTRALELKSYDEMAEVIRLVKSGELTPKEAIKRMRGLTPETADAKMQELYDIYKTGKYEPTIGIEPEPITVPKKSNIWQYPNVTPEQFKTLNVTDRVYLAANPNAKYNTATQSITRSTTASSATAKLVTNPTPAGMPVGTKLSINQAQAFRNNPNLTWNQLKNL